MSFRVRISTLPRHSPLCRFRLGGLRRHLGKERAIDPASDNGSQEKGRPLQHIFDVANGCSARCEACLTLVNQAKNSIQNRTVANLDNHAHLALGRLGRKEFGHGFIQRRMRRLDRRTIPRRRGKANRRSELVY